MRTGEEEFMKKATKLCENCKHVIQVTKSNIQLKSVDVGLDEPILVTYMECPVCGDITLCQLDTEDTYALGINLAKKERLRNQGKLTKGQKQRLQQLNKQLCNKRGNLKPYWGQVYQLICD